MTIIRHISMCGMTIIKQEITIKDGVVTGTMPRRALRLVYEWLDLHRDELMDNWERLSNSEAPVKIEPLK